MPRLSTRIPSYRLHRASGQAVVTLDGDDIYLGPYGSPESKAEYSRLVGIWQVNGRRMPGNMLADSDAGMTVNELFLAYWEHARAYYCKNGQATAEQGSIREAVATLIQFFGDTAANEFGPLSLKTVRNAMIEKNLARSTINGHIGRIKRIFRWGTENELIDARVYHALQAVAGLRRGRSAARETPPVRPVPEKDIQAVLLHVSPQVGAMIQLQYLTGMRSGEVMIMRGCDLETRGQTWKYTPSTHKTEHHGIERVIFLGPQAQKVLGPFLKPGDAYLFSPQDAEAERNGERRRSRRTHMWKSHQPEWRRQRRLKGRSIERTPGKNYTTDSYRRAIARACDVAFPPPPPLARKEGETETDWLKRLTEEQQEELADWQKAHRWHPHQLRHSAATRLRKEYGIEAARVVLGHRSAAVTETYAELDQTKAADVMAKVG